ncbi:hypothetical protein I656_00009 [Geobacillus sp. WSUCF1]|nr:hypothetical protein I656_00009 [Geobacillus sp. WSUCF1]
MFDFVIKMEDNKHKYLIRMVNYTKPLGWVPFNDFQINQVNEIE